MKLYQVKWMHWPTSDMNTLPYLQQKLSVGGTEQDAINNLKDIMDDPANVNFTAEEVVSVQGHMVLVVDEQQDFFAKTPFANKQDVWVVFDGATPYTHPGCYQSKVCGIDFETRTFEVDYCCAVNPQWLYDISNDEFDFGEYGKKVFITQEEALEAFNKSRV